MTAPRKQTKDLLPKFDNWVDEFAWSANSKWIFVAVDQRVGQLFTLLGWTEIVIAPIIGEAPKDEPPSGKNLIGEFSGLSATPSAKGLLVAVQMKADQPAEVVRIDPSPIIVEGRDAKGRFGECCLVADVYRLTHLNDALLAQLDLAPHRILLVHRRRQNQGPRLPHQAPGLRPRQKIPRQVPDPRRPARRMGRLVGAIAGTPNSSPPTATSSS